MTFGAKYILQLHKIIFSPADQPYFANFNPAVEFFLKFSLKECTNIDVADWYHPFSTYAKFFEKKLFFTHAPSPLPTFSEIVLCQGCFPGKFAFVSFTKASKIFLAPAFPEFGWGPCYRLICICRLRC